MFKRFLSSQPSEPPSEQWKEESGNDYDSNDNNSSTALKSTTTSTSNNNINNNNNHNNPSTSSFEPKSVSSTLRLANNIDFQSSNISAIYTSNGTPINLNSMLRRPSFNLASPSELQKLHENSLVTTSPSASAHILLSERRTSPLKRINSPKEGMISDEEESDSDEEEPNSSRSLSTTSDGKSPSTNISITPSITLNEYYLDPLAIDTTLDKTNNNNINKVISPKSAKNLASMLDQFIEPSTVNNNVNTNDDTINSNGNGMNSNNNSKLKKINTTPSITGITKEECISNNNEKSGGSLEQQQQNYVTISPGRYSLDSKAVQKTSSTTPRTSNNNVTSPTTPGVVSNNNNNNNNNNSTKKTSTPSTNTKTVTFESDVRSLQNRSFKFIDEEGREYFYTGTVIGSTNELHGRGELHYPNRTIYEGDFVNGKRHGFGKIIFPNHHSKKDGPTSIAIGQWSGNNPSEDIPWKITYEDQMEYWGYVKLKSKAVGKTILTLEDFEKHKEGELYHIKLNEKYFGDFKSDEKYGFGVEIYANGERYYGGWKHNKYHYLGTYQYQDGTYWQGTFKRGQRKGKGKLFLPNGDILEGLWSDNRVEGATYYKGTTKNVHLTHLYQLQFQVNESVKMFCNMGHMDELAAATYNPECIKPACDMKWIQYIVNYKEQWKKERTSLVKRFVTYNKQTGKYEVLLHQGPTMENVRNTFTTAVGLLLSGGLDEAKFISNFVNFFISIFCGSYYFGGNNNNNTKSMNRKTQATLIYHAIDDIKSFIMYLTDKVIWDFFYREVFSLADNNSSSSSSSSSSSNNHNYSILDLYEKEFYPICKNIISNVIHEKLFSTLFELYNYHYRDSDLLMNQKIKSVQSCPIKMFGISYEFSQTFDDTTNEQPYEESIKLLELIRNAKSVKTKIETLAKVRQSIMQTMKRYRTNCKRMEYISQQIQRNNTKAQWTSEMEKKCEEWQPGADDTTPVYSYVFCKANLDNFTATFHYVNDWKSEQVNFDPVSHIIRFFEGFLSYVQDLDPNILHDGQFISKYALSKGLERAIENQIIKTKDKNLPFYWLPSLLVHIGLEIGKSVASSRNSFSNSDSVISAGKSGFNPFSKMLTLTKNLEIVDISNQNLFQSLQKSIDLVNNTLVDAGMGFTLGEQREEGIIVIKFDKVFPSYVYSDIALDITKFIKYEIENIMII